MKLAINLKLSSVLDLFRKNLGFGLLAFLVLIGILTFFVMYGEVRKITESQIDSSNSSQIVRVNLDAHKQLEKKLNDNTNFVPVSVPGANAFGTAPNKTN